MNATMKELYWFARGYYDGRSFGNQEASAVELYDDESKHFYRRGYDSGVADYCAIAHEDEVNV
jgi:hypothetical protein